MPPDSEPAKNVVDAILVPTGILTAFFAALNEVLTAILIFTTIVWTVYRVVDMHERRKERKKREKDDVDST